MEFEWTPEFYGVYSTIDDKTSEVTDAMILRLVEEHKTAWARRGRVTGLRDAWIVSGRTHNADIDLYWEYKPPAQDSIILLLLIVAAA